MQDAAGQAWAAARTAWCRKGTGARCHGVAAVRASHPSSRHQRPRRTRPARRCPPAGPGRPRWPSPPPRRAAPRAPRCPAWHPGPSRIPAPCAGLFLGPSLAPKHTACNPAWLELRCTPVPHTHRHCGIHVRPQAAPGPPPAPRAHPRQARLAGGRRARRRRRRRQAQQQRGPEAAGVARGAAREEAVPQQVLGGRAVRRVGHQALREYIAQLLRARGTPDVNAAGCSAMAALC